MGDWVRSRVVIFIYFCLSSCLLFPVKVNKVLNIPCRQLRHNVEKCSLKTSSNCFTINLSPQTTQSSSRGTVHNNLKVTSPRVVGLLLLLLQTTFTSQTSQIKTVKLKFCMSSFNESPNTFLNKMNIICKRNIPHFIFRWL